MGFCVIAILSTDVTRACQKGGEGGVGKKTSKFFFH